MADNDPFSARLASGEEAAFAELFDRYGSRMFRVAARCLASPEDAEDVVQEVFVSLVRSRARLQDVENLKAYVFTALRRRIAQTLARRQSSPARLELSLEEAGTPVGIPVENDCLGDRLHRAVRRLSAAERSVVALRIDGGLTFAEIGRALEIPLHTAASRYRSALEKLRTSMEDTSSGRS